LLQVATGNGEWFMDSQFTIRIYLSDIIRQPVVMKHQSFPLLFSASLLLALAPAFTAAYAPPQQPYQHKNSNAFGLERRAWLATAATTAAATLVPLSARAEGTTSLKKFNDAKHGFSLSVPSDWTFSEQTLPDRREILLWQDPSDKSTLLFIAYTPLRDDYTSLGSFGSVETVAAQTILPKGAMMGEPEDPALKMVSATSEKQAYIFDYRHSVPGGQGDSTPVPTHFRTIFSMRQGATGGAGSVLVTITAQTPETRYTSQLQPTFDGMINSYGKSV
jgi:hypothetical protein